jgi:hypothetical protein
VADRNGTWIQLTNATSWLNRSADLCRQHFFRVHVEYGDLQFEFESMRLSKVENFDDRDQLGHLKWGNPSNAIKIKFQIQIRSTSLALGVSAKITLCDQHPLNNK